MTMEINALLFVQMGNFFIAYCILRFVVFEPGLKIITHIDETKQSMLRDLALGQEEIERREALNNDQKERHTAVLRSRMPKQKKESKTISSSGAWRRVERLSPEEEVHLVTTIKDVIVHHLERRHS